MIVTDKKKKKNYSSGSSSNNNSAGQNGTSSDDNEAGTMNLLRLLLSLDNGPRSARSASSQQIQRRSSSKSSLQSQQQEQQRQQQQQEEEAGGKDVEEKKGEDKKEDALSKQLLFMQQQQQQEEQEANPQENLCDSYRSANSATTLSSCCTNTTTSSAAFKYKPRRKHAAAGPATTPISTAGPPSVQTLHGENDVVQASNNGNDALKHQMMRRMSSFDATNKNALLKRQTMSTNSMVSTGSTMDIRRRGVSQLLSNQDDWGGALSREGQQREQQQGSSGSDNSFKRQVAGMASTGTMKDLEKRHMPHIPLVNKDLQNQDWGVGGSMDPRPNNSVSTGLVVGGPSMKNRQMMPTSGGMMSHGGTNSNQDLRASVDWGDGSNPNLNVSATTGTSSQESDNSFKRQVAGMVSTGTMQDLEKRHVPLMNSDLQNQDWVGGATTSPSAGLMVRGGGGGSPSRDHHMPTDTTLNRQLMHTGMVSTGSMRDMMKRRVMTTKERENQTFGYENNNTALARKPHHWQQGRAKPGGATLRDQKAILERRLKESAQVNTYSAPFTCGNARDTSSGDNNMEKSPKDVMHQLRDGTSRHQAQEAEQTLSKNKDSGVTQKTGGTDLFLRYLENKSKSGVIVPPSVPTPLGSTDARDGSTNNNSNSTSAAQRGFGVNSKSSSAGDDLLVSWGDTGNDEEDEDDEDGVGPIPVCIPKQQQERIITPRSGSGPIVWAGSFAQNERTITINHEAAQRRVSDITTGFEYDDNDRGVITINHSELAQRRVSDITTGFPDDDGDGFQVDEERAPVALKKKMRSMSIAEVPGRR